MSQHEEVIGLEVKGQRCGSDRRLLASRVQLRSTCNSHTVDVNENRWSCCIIPDFSVAVGSPSRRIPRCRANGVCGLAPNNGSDALPLTRSAPTDSGLSRRHRYLVWDDFCSPDQHRGLAEALTQAASRPTSAKLRQSPRLTPAESQFR